MKPFWLPLARSRLATYPSGLASSAWRRNTQRTLGLPGSTLAVTPQPGNASPIATASAAESRTTASAQSSVARPGRSPGGDGCGCAVRGNVGHRPVVPVQSTGGNDSSTGAAGCRDASGTNGSAISVGHGVSDPGECGVQPGAALVPPPDCVDSRVGASSP